MDILVNKKDGLVVDHGAITEEKNNMWKIEKGGETHIRDGEFEKYTVDSLPEYYEDYKNGDTSFWDKGQALSGSSKETQAIKAYNSAKNNNVNRNRYRFYYRL